MSSKLLDSEPLVGRQIELEKLHGIFADVTHGRGRFVLVTGEAGIGKTSVVQHFAVDCTASGAIALWTACFEAEWQPPYSVWVDALEQLAGYLSDHRASR